MRTADPLLGAEGVKGKEKRGERVESRVIPLLPHIDRLHTIATHGLSVFRSRQLAAVLLLRPLTHPIFFESIIVYVNLYPTPIVLSRFIPSAPLCTSTCPT